MTIRRGGSIIAGAFGELPSQTGQSGKYLTTNGSVTSWSDIQSGSFRNIGEIVTSTIPLTDAELHLLDGALISGGGIYDDFVQYIAGLSGSYPQCFTDETTWQNTVNSKGVCGKFVYNSTNNTVRLPKITGFIEGTIDSNALGNLVEAGLPNITGNLRGVHGGASAAYDWGFGTNSDGVFSVTQNLTKYNQYGGDYDQVSGNVANFDASRSNSIYGNSNTVQPQAIKVYYYIVIATTTKTDIEVDIDEVITDLNSKANDIDVVHKTGDETISGEKTFTNGVVRFYRLNSTNQHIEFIYNGQDPNQGNYPGAYLPIESLGTGWKKIYTEHNFQVVSTLPANPDADTFYLIPE